MWKNLLRRVRGVLGNATVWGAAWVGGGLAFLLALLATSEVPRFLLWRIVVYVSATWGVTGFLTGAAFSVFLAIGYRDRRLAEIRVAPFAFGGAAIAAIFSPIVDSLVHLSVGFPSNFHPFFVGGLWAPILGGITAAATISLAREREGSERGRGAPRQVGPGSSDGPMHLGRLKHLVSR